MKKNIRYAIGIAGILLIISIILGFFMPFLQALRIVFGSIYILFLPGFILTYIFFPGKEKIDWIERIALSFALSIAVVPLFIFYLNLLGMKINLINCSLAVLGIIIISVVVKMILRKKSQK